MKYRTVKLCAYKHESGANVTMPSGQEIELDPKDAEALLALGAIAPLGEGEEVPAEDDAARTDGGLDGQQFATWLAAGAGAREVVAWIGDSAVRAETAKVDERPSVQKAIKAILEAPADEPDPNEGVEPNEGDDEDAPGDDEDNAGDEEE